ncbi:ABC transporter permease [Xanthobacter sediminis]
MDHVFTTALRNQWRSLLAMVMAEYAGRVSKRSLGILEELFSLGVMGGSMLLVRRMTGAPTHHGMPIVPFLISGLVLFWVMRTTLFRVAALKNAKAAFKINPRVTALDVLAARALLNVTFYICIAFPFFTLFYFLDWSPFMNSPGQVLFLMLLMGLWGFSLGLCFGALFLYVPSMRMVASGLMMVLMWTSGIMFLWPEAPYMLRGILIYNPIFHFMELMRTAYFSTYLTPMGSWRYIITTVMVTLALGLMLERVTRRRAESGVQRQGADDDTFDEAMV